MFFYLWKFRVFLVWFLIFDNYETTGCEFGTKSSENKSETQLGIWFWLFDCPADELSLLEYIRRLWCSLDETGTVTGPGRLNSKLQPTLGSLVLPPMVTSYRGFCVGGFVGGFVGEMCFILILTSFTTSVLSRYFIL